MPVSSTSAFSDPGDFQSALSRYGIVRVIPTQAVDFRARLTDIRLSQLGFVAAREYVSRVAIVVAPADQVLIAFPMTAEGAHHWDERRLGLGELVVMSEAAHNTWRIRAPARWGAILQPKQLLVDCLHTIVGEKAHLPAPGLTLWRARAPAFWDLLKIIRAVVRHSIHVPEAPVKTEASHGLEQELITSLVELLTDMSPQSD